MIRNAEKRHAGSRTRARRLAMQAIYQCLLNDTSIADIESQFLEDPESQSADQEFLSELIVGVLQKRPLLAGFLSPHMDRPIEQVDPVERAILLISAYELKYALSIPYRVIINEAVELTKTYGAEQAHKFVNAVLDKLAVELRPTEKV